LYVLSLCLASNDIALHHRVIDDAEAEEQSYHFAVSISILREVAKLIEQIDKHGLRSKFHGKTEELFQQIRERLVPFEDDSLTKGNSGDGLLILIREHWLFGQN
jgi:hypothetical protein